MTIPLKGLGWEPTEEGTKLSIGPEFEVELNTVEVNELHSDMQEAYMLSRGCQRLEVKAEEVEQYDKVYVGCDVLMVSDVLTSREGTVLQFGDTYAELILPSDKQITVWRTIS